MDQKFAKIDQEDCRSEQEREVTETPSQEVGGDVVVMCSNGSNSCFKMQ